MSDKNTYFVCKLCHNKKEYSSIKGVSSHLDVFHSGFAFQCTLCNNIFRYKDGHKRCNRAPMKRVKEANKKFGEKEGNEYKEFQQNKRQFIDTISRQADNDQENRVKSSWKLSTERNRKQRKPFKNLEVTERTITSRALTSPVKRAKMDTETFAGADVLSLDAPSDDSLFDEDDRPTLDTEPETIPQVEIKDSEPEMIAQVEITDSEPETIPQVEITDSEPETMAQVETVVEPEESETQSSVQVEQVESVKEKIAQVEPVSGGYVEPVQSIEYNPTSIVKKLQKIQVCQESPVHVMVGGTKFVTSIPTITAEPSLLSAMVDKDSIVRPQMIDNIPTYSLDRNPEEFSVILDYLRNKGNVPARYELPVTTNQLENQLLEATFYELEGLKALIVDKLH